MNHLDDVSSASFMERKRLFLETVYGKTATSPDLSYTELIGAGELATAEMLDEIHLMLRVLLNIKPKD